MKKIMHMSSVFLVVILISVFFSGCGLGNNSKKPLLKVVLEYNDLGPLDGGKDYYNIYSNEKYERIQEFEISNDIDAYSLDDAQTEYEKTGVLTGTDLPSYTLEIIKASKEIGNNYITQLYVIEGKYYFAIADTRTVQNKYSSALYEYLPDNDEYKLIVGFEHGYIKHVQ